MTYSNLLYRGPPSQFPHGAVPDLPFCVLGIFLRNLYKRLVGNIRCERQLFGFLFFPSPSSFSILPSCPLQRRLIGRPVWPQLLRTTLRRINLFLGRPKVGPVTLFSLDPVFWQGIFSFSLQTGCEVPCGWNLDCFCTRTFFHVACVDALAEARLFSCSLSICAFLLIFLPLSFCGPLSLSPWSGLSVVLLRSTDGPTHLTQQELRPHDSKVFLFCACPTLFVGAAESPLPPPAPRFF